jgi:ABC-2 type transport system permease protein
VSTAGEAAGPPELRPVRGPTALGGGRRRFFELLMLVSVTEFRQAYFGTVLGYFWSLLRPLMLFGILLVVFTQVFRVGSGIENFPVFLLLNIVVFGFFQESTLSAVQSIVNQEGIVRKTQFPRLVIPLAVVMTALFSLGVNLVAVFIFALAYGVEPMWSWLGLVPILALLFVFTTAVSMIVSSLFVRFRDVGIIWSVAVTALFYGTPILYPLGVVPDSFRDVVLCNPLTPVFSQLRVWVVDSGAPTALQVTDTWHLLVGGGIFLVTCVFAVWVFSREAPRIAEEL